MAGNNYFQFKQFTIEQHHASMKVGTDGVLLGAWASHLNPHSILDIGTGTGLVSLMLAQRFPIASIVAIDIDEGAYSDAKHNFNTSIWKDRLQVLHLSLQQFAENNRQTFDLVVSNPPFFTNAFQSKEKGRTTARHSNELSFEELIELTASMISENSIFSVIIPSEEERNFRNIAANHRLFARRLLRIFPNPSKPAKRVLIEFQKEAHLESESNLVIESMTHHDYTPEFISLVRDFYLKL